MSKIFNFDGFPNEVSEYIELPSIGELLKVPMFQSGDADDAYKYGGEIVRYLLDKAPIKHDKNYVHLTNNIQLLDPRFLTFPRFRDYFDISDWHIDTSHLAFGEDRAHILSNDCTCRTEFNADPFSIELPDDARTLDITHYFKDHSELNLKGKKAEPNKFTTFNLHVHRGTHPEKTEFRFFFRVLETNRPPRPLDMSRSRQSFVYNKDTGEAFKSIGHIYNKNSIDQIVIHYH